MKRVIPIWLCLAALLISLPGCGTSGPQCDIVVFPAGTNGQNFVAGLLWCDGFRDTRRVGFDGRVRVPLRGCAHCGDIIVTSFRQIFTFSASPSSIDLLDPPSSVTFSGGGGLDTTYGLPRVAYYDAYGTFVGMAWVTEAGGDGTWLIANTPYLGQVYTGNYTVQISNKAADGTWELIGEANGDAWNRDPPPEGGYDCHNQDPNMPQMVCPPEY